jgi:hypothetical protein
LKNIRICNGKINGTLAHVDGILVVKCFRNNGGHFEPPIEGFNFTVITEIPRNKSRGGSGDSNHGIEVLVEIEGTDGHGVDPNVTATQTVSTNTVTITNAGPGLTFSYLA